MVALVAVMGMVVMGCVEDPPICDASLKHLTTVSNYPTNVLRQEIGANPALAPNSAAIISRQVQTIGQDALVTCAIRDYQSPVYYVGASQSKNTYIRVHLDGSPSYQGVTQAGPIRWRSCITGGPAADGACIVVDEVDGCQYELWMLNRNGLIADPECGTISGLPTTDADAIFGLDDGCSGGTAGGFSKYCSFVWPDECSTSYNHGFMFATRQDINNPSKVALPAVHTDGIGTHEDDLFQGMRVQLNPSYDISGLPTYSRSVAQAMKTYGMYDGNSNNGGWNVKGVLNQGYTNNPWNGVLPDPTVNSFSIVPIAQFRVMAPVWGVKRAGVSSNDCITYRYQAGVNTPTITSISPTSGPVAGGTTITLTGTRFTNGTVVNDAYVGGLDATNLNVISDTLATCVTPAYPQAGEIHVAVAKSGLGTSNRVHFTYTASGPLPTISSLSPNNGTTAGGTSVTLTGTNLTSTTSVSFGGTAATGIVNVSGTQVRCTSPAHSAGTVSVTATTANGTSNGVNFTYNAPAPTLSAMAPTSGTTAGGTACTLTGTGLTGCSAVSFGATAATGIAVDSSTQVRCTSPAKSAGTCGVTATTAGGTSNAVSYTYAGGGYTATLYAAADARVHSTSTAQNFGSQVIMYVQKNASVESASYIKWDLNSVQGSTITSAKIRLYQSSTTACTNYVYSCAADSWVESTIKWGARPAWGTPQASFSLPASAGWREIDVTAYVSANFSGDKLVTVVIRDDASQNIQAGYHSKENTSNNKPSLVVISQ